MIAVTFALPFESSAFIKLLRDRAAQTAGLSGRLGQLEVRVLHTGVGESASRNAIDRFLAQHSPALLISSGFAGALTDELAAGDLLLASNYTSLESLEAAREVFAGRAKIGVLATAAAVTDAAAERDALARDSGAIAVDMETAVIVAACRAASVPTMSLRVISDTPAAPLPAPSHLLFDVERQRTPLGPLSLHLLRHPGALFRLLAFTRRVERAREQLARALARLLIHLSVTKRL